MNVEREAVETAQIHVQNIGGIEETTVEFDPGLTVLAGRNATNRTSLLRAIMAALGSDDVTPKAGTEEGKVELDMRGETYTRTVTVGDGSTVLAGEPYSNDLTAADSFAFLLESNDARRAVARGANLREVAMQPVDTDAIDREIEELEGKKRRLDTEIEELDQLEREREQLENERVELGRRLTKRKETRDELESRLNSLDTAVDESQAIKQELREKVEELSEARTDVERVETEIAAKKDSIDALKEEQAELTEELEGARSQDVLETDLDEVETEINRLRSRRRELQTRTSQLQDLIQFNRDQLEKGTDTVPLDANSGDGGGGDGDVTDALLEGDTVTCWTCGSTVDRDQIEATVDQLRAFRAEKVEEIDGIEKRLDELTDRRDLYEKTHERIRRLETRLDETRSDLENRQDRVTELKGRRAELTETVEELDRAVAELENEENERVLELHREISDLQSEIGRLENEYDGVERKLDDVTSRLDNRDELTERRSEIQAELADLRSRVDRIEEEFITQFNERMDDVLELLGYENIERIWIERTERTEREGRRKVTRSAFELHIVRVTEDGTHFEDEITNLSESEREVTGLVFTLAGYLVHELYDEVPFLLLDSVEAVDAGRLQQLIDYLDDYARYTVIALLEEDAATVTEDYPMVTSI